MIDCWEAIDLMEYAIEGQLAADARAGFDEHIGECHKCRNYFVQLEATCRTLEHLDPGTATSPYRAELLEEFKKHMKRG